MPAVGARHREPLEALGVWVEGAIPLTPRIFVAGARSIGSAFSRSGTRPRRPLTWDADVDRVEAGGG